MPAGPQAYRPSARTVQTLHKKIVPLSFTRPRRFQRFLVLLAQRIQKALYECTKCGRQRGTEMRLERASPAQLECEQSNVAACFSALSLSSSKAWLRFAAQAYPAWSRFTRNKNAKLAGGNPVVIVPSLTSACCGWSFLWAAGGPRLSFGITNGPPVHKFDERIHSQGHDAMARQ